MWPLILILSALFNGLTIMALLVIAPNRWPIVILAILWILTYWRWLTLEFHNEQENERKTQSKTD